MKNKGNLKVHSKIVGKSGRTGKNVTIKTREIQSRHNELLKKHKKQKVKQVEVYSEIEKRLIEQLEKKQKDKQEKIAEQKSYSAEQQRERLEQRRLSTKQKEDLQGIKNIIDTEAKKTARRIRTKSNTIETSKCFAIATILAIVLGTLLSAMIKFKVEMPKIKEVGNSESVVSISMNKETFGIDLNIDKLSINTIKDNYLTLNDLTWTSLDADITSNTYSIGAKEYNVSSELALKTLDINKDMVYMQYTNKEDTASKELILAKNIPAEVNTRTMNINGLRFKEKSNAIQVQALANSFEDSFIMLSETLAGGKLSIKSLKEELLNTESYMTKSRINRGITVKIDELGDVNLNKFSELGNEAELVYDAQYNILRLRNASEDTDYIYICGINNDVIGCRAEDLVATTNEKLYIHLDFDNPDSNGYKVFALKSENNLYCFKLNEIAHESLIDCLFEQLGIDVDKIEIKKIQRVVNNE